MGGSNIETSKFTIQVSSETLLEKGIVVGAGQGDKHYIAKILYDV